MVFNPTFDENKGKGDALFMIFGGKEEFLTLNVQNEPFLDWEPEEPVSLKIFLGTLDERPLFALCYEELPILPEDSRSESFRDAFRCIPYDSQHPVSRGKQLLEWRRNHRFCGSCGTETALSGEEHVLKCPSCGALWFPVISPAVITRITCGEKILLANNVRFPEGLYSHIAGFVDPGETVENAIAREVREEVGLEVENIRFFGSQAWPMPHSLMLAFTAECREETTPVPDGIEITDARWFTRDTLPNLPRNDSIAGLMLKEYIAGADFRDGNPP